MEVVRSGGWRNRLVTEQVYPEEDILIVLEQEETWLLRHKMEDKAIKTLKGWKWRGEGSDFKWFRCTRDWIRFLEKQKDFSDVMDEKWSWQSILLSWKQRWGNLWDATMTYRRKMWLWKLLQRGYFTNSRAREMGHSGGECQACETQLETIEHVFWECRRLQRSFKWLRNSFTPTRVVSEIAYSRLTKAEFVFERGSGEEV
ncbi:hypothetical protein R1sor_023870 [Riccia sorocarpa]|uniref:Reverse transcriptase zinc-binding domain-containing protein n=1 Tax=Riccia sorocarpa TaxID=122646 RepID=A0ABD3GUT0_9MARC